MNEPKLYDPNIDYFMVSVFDDIDVRWIRNQFMTTEELRDWHVAVKRNSVRYRNFEVFNEKTLDIASKYPMTEDDDCEMTLREALFGPNYQWYADYFRTGNVDGVTD